MSVSAPLRRKRILAAVLGLLAAALVAEGVCRIDALFPGKAYDADKMHQFLVSRAEASNYGDLADFAPTGSGIDPNEHRPVPDPWSGWTSPWHIRQVARGTHWFSRGPHDQVFDVVLLGGSFAAQFGNVNFARLKEWIATFPEVGGQPVELWNLSVAAQKQPSHLHRLTGVLAEGWKPDLVICIDGYNELALAAENLSAGVDPVYPSVAFWGGMARAGDVDTKALDLLVEMRAAQLTTASRANLGLRFGLWRSALLSRALSAWMSRSQREFRETRERHMVWLGSERSQIAIRGPVAGLYQAGEPAQVSGDPPGMIEGIAAWANSARNLRAICDRRHIALVHALQPGLDDAGSKLVTDEERRNNKLGGPWLAAIQNGYPLLRERVTTLAREDVLIRDGTRLFADNSETLYIDGCHLTDHGYELYAQAVAGWVREALASR
jgi:hypothetical protein